MLKVMITTTIASKRDADRLVQFPLEVDAIDMREVADRLTQEGILYGECVSTSILPDGRRVAIARSPKIVGKNAIATISPTPFEYFEPAEVAADE